MCARSGRRETRQHRRGPTRSWSHASDAEGVPGDPPVPSVTTGRPRRPRRPWRHRSPARPSRPLAGIGLGVEHVGSSTRTIGIRPIRQGHRAACRSRPAGVNADTPRRKSRRPIRRWRRARLRRAPPCGPRLQGEVTVGVEDDSPTRTRAPCGAIARVSRRRHHRRWPRCGAGGLPPARCRHRRSCHRRSCHRRSSHRLSRHRRRRRCATDAPHDRRNVGPGAGPVSNT